MTVDEWIIYIDSNPVLTEVDIEGLRKAFYINGWIDAVMLSKLFTIDESIDYVNSHLKLQNLLIWVVVDYLINDTDESDITLTYDVVTRSEGDSVLRYINKSNLSQEFKTALLLKIEEMASVIESNKLLDAIDVIYTEFPYYGHRRIWKQLLKDGFTIGRKLVKSAMNFMGIKAIYPKPKTTIAIKEHKKYLR